MNRPWGRIVGVTLGLAALAAAALLARTGRTPEASGGAARELWLYHGVNLADSAAYARIAPIWRRAAAAGYTRVVVMDQKFARLATQDSAYFRRIRELRALAAELHLELIPGVCLVGRGNGAMLAMDPNLAEALPVRDAAFEVRDGIAHPVADPPVTLVAKPDRVDFGITLSSRSVRIPGGNTGRVAWNLAVAPWHAYHVSVRIAGENFRGEPRLRVMADGREIAFTRIAPPQGAAPEVRDVAFNSQTYRNVTVWLSLSSSSTGALTWSDWRIEEPGPVNLVRRGGMAFRFAGLREGRDYDPVVDPGLGTRGGSGTFDQWHALPPIHVRRPDGTRLRASWYAAGVLLKGQASCCLSDSGVHARLADEVARVRGLFGARTLFLMHDEIRVIGQDAVCAATGRTSAQILAANLRDCRRLAGDARVVVWNDMFDPNHNAVDGFYLVRGDLAGAWDGLDRDVIVANWNSGKPAASLAFFSGRGNPQVWAGYYDRPVESVREILPLLDRTPGVQAVMYTTWQDRYDDLEAFAKLCRPR